MGQPLKGRNEEALVPLLSLVASTALVLIVLLAPS
ncbi:hypothetical protein QOZ94_000691 [Xanthobacter agilis]|jgi:hypothetical protein|uniref:Uncharacterized protein n=1 Tax=Xanthobacter agilis TaxID=47492 RepID=A0ABU0L9X1_XANAG|nr:hypothetical protein [Xanthobacter agilis]